MPLDDPKTPASTEPSEDSLDPRPTRRDWPDKPGSPEWFAVSQERTDACLDGQERIERRLIRMDERQARGGPLVRLAMAAGSGLTTIAVVALGEKGRNVPFLSVGVVALVALLWGGSYVVSGMGFTLATGAQAGQAPLPPRTDAQPTDGPQ